MINVSSLNFIHKIGKFGDYDGKEENDLLKISEKNGLLIFQIAKYKNSSFDISKIKIDGLNFPSSLRSSTNSNTRVLWLGPDNWVVFSSNLDLIEKEKKQFNENDFAITNISHSRTIIELEGDLTNEVLKKGCPLDINSFKKGDCVSSFGESLYHSITDACLEFGYKAI